MGVCDMHVLVLWAWIPSCIQNEQLQVAVEWYHMYGKNINHKRGYWKHITNICSFLQTLLVLLNFALTFLKVCWKSDKRNHCNIIHIQITVKLIQCRKNFDPASFTSNLKMWWMQQVETSSIPICCIGLNNGLQIHTENWKLYMSVWLHVHKASVWFLWMYTYLLVYDQWCQYGWHSTGGFYEMLVLIPELGKKNVCHVIQELYQKRTVTQPNITMKAGKQLTRGGQQSGVIWYNSFCT